jgi:hypothetical protein
MRMGFCRVTLTNKGHVKDVEIAGRVQFKWIFVKDDGKMWTGLSWLRVRTMSGASERGNEPSGSIKCE